MGVGEVHRWTSSDGRYEVSTDRERIDIAYVHAFLTTSCWAQGIPREVVERSIEHSIPFGLRTKDAHALYARFGFAVPHSPDRIMFLDPATRDTGYDRCDTPGPIASRPGTS